MVLFCWQLSLVDTAVRPVQQTLFAFQKLTLDNTASDLPKRPVLQKWWKYMSDIMEYTDEGTPVAVPLEEMFHVD